jgi:hypothetical protein
LGAAASKNHVKIEAVDFEQGFHAYSLDVLVNTNLEIRDVAPRHFDAVFALLGLKWRTSKIDISLALLSRGFIEPLHAKIIDTMIWYGVLGVRDSGGGTTFIYDVEYNYHVLEQLRANRGEDGEIFEINRAFWPALKVDHSDVVDGQIKLI